MNGTVRRLVEPKMSRSDQRRPAGCFTPRLSIHTIVGGSYLFFPNERDRQRKETLMHLTSSRRIIVVVMVCCLGSAHVNGAEAIILDTTQVPLEFTSWNQGWWSSTKQNFNTTNVSPFLGSLDGHVHRNFFTFFIPPLETRKVISATLLQHRGMARGNEKETIAFYHVVTPAAVLNHNVGFNMSIFDDLGSGTTYGEFTISTLGGGDTLYEFDLNTAAVSDINVAGGGYFSLGGTLLSDDGDDFIFATLREGPAMLRLVVVPEPSTIAIALVLSTFVCRSRQHPLFTNRHRTTYRRGGVAVT